MTTGWPAEMLVVDEAEFGGAAADALLARVPSVRPRIGVATGGTPMRLYAELASRTRAGDIDLSGATVVALDEYVGLGAGDARSYAAYVGDRIAGPLGVCADNVLVPDGLAEDPAEEAEAFEARIGALGSIDVQIAGIGTNGHLAFNEPGSSFGSTTRVVTLSERTREDNARFFDGDLDRTPKQAITQGLQTIMRARSVLLLAAGTAKARALGAALRGPLTAEVPASMLQRHPDVCVIADRDAAAML